MFSGLSNFFKKILPKRLFYRALLIVAAPILVLQLVITIVFFDSLWIKTNKGMTRALINEISTFVEVYDNEKIDRGELTNLFSLFLDFSNNIRQDMKVISKYLFENIKNKNFTSVEPKNIESLILEISKTNLGIFIDSGPLHIAKCFNIHGVFVETT